VALVRERTIRTERPPPVGEVSANLGVLFRCQWATSGLITSQLKPIYFIFTPAQ